MSAFMIVGVVGIVVCSLASESLAKWRITNPVALIMLGAIAVLLFGEDLGEHLNTEVAERVVEVVLAILLFSDATEVRGRMFGERTRLSVRLIVVALPLSLTLAVLTGLLVLPQLPLSVLLVLACVVMPTDLATAPGVLGERRIPGRLRHALNIESGYNDAVVSPVFLIAVAAALDSRVSASSPLSIVEHAVYPFLLALAVGAVVGWGSGWITARAIERGLTTSAASRIGVAALPLLAYLISFSVQGNGFVAAFVAGIAFRLARTGTGAERIEIPHVELTAVEDMGTIASSAIWFVLGGVFVLAVETGIDWQVVLYAALALTVLRMLPVWLALLGTATTWVDRTVVGLLGPRGPASIVFGLLAYNILVDDEADVLLYTMALTVVGSALLHGMVAPALSLALLRRGERVSSG